MAVSFHKFTNAKTDSTVYLADNLIFAWYTLDGATHIIANGGASIPVKETIDVVKTKLEGDNNGKSNEGSDDSVSKHQTG